MVPCLAHPAFSNIDEKQIHVVLLYCAIKLVSSRAVKLMH